MVGGTTFDTNHEDMIHDVQLNYYGRRLATCSSDRKIKIFDIDENSQAKQTAELVRHEGPVWQVAWAHPKFGTFLASAGYDRKVIIWREGNKNEWHPVFESSDLHTLSVNSIAWAPHEIFPTLTLATASSDGKVNIISASGDTFAVTHSFNAHAGGVNAVSWAPAISVGAAVRTQPTGYERKLVTGGCDKAVKIWMLDEHGNAACEKELGSHNDWVRDVAWAPSIGLPSSTIASCSQDGAVYIWSKSEPNAEWTKTELERKDKKDNVQCWRVSWSIAGNILAVSSSDNQVTLWKESPEGNRWENISVLDENNQASLSS